MSNTLPSSDGLSCLWCYEGWVAIPAFRRRAAQMAFQARDVADPVTRLIRLSAGFGSFAKFGQLHAAVRSPHFRLEGMIAVYRERYFDLAGKRGIFDRAAGIRISCAALTGIFEFNRSAENSGNWSPHDRRMFTAGPTTKVFFSVPRDRLGSAVGAYRSRGWPSRFPTKTAASGGCATARFITIQLAQNL